MIGGMRNDRFTFMPGDLKEVTDSLEVAEAQRRAGFTPPTAEEQAWISKEGQKRLANGDFVSTDELRAEYDRLQFTQKIAGEEHDH